MDIRDIGLAGIDLLESRVIKLEKENAELRAQLTTYREIQEYIEGGDDIREACCKHEKEKLLAEIERLTGQIDAMHRAGLGPDWTEKLKRALKGALVAQGGTTTGPIQACGRRCVPMERLEAEIEQMKENMTQSTTLSPSQVCKTYHIQNCHACDDADCGDNQTPSVLKLRAEVERRKQLED